MINPECVSKIINNLDTSKATQQGYIPTKIIKGNKDFFSYFISASFNNDLNKGVFPDELKQVDFKPVYKRESKNEKENYKPVSILPNLSKIFERYMYDQLKGHFDKLLSKYQCGFRKRFTTQHCLLAMTEKLRKSLDSAVVELKFFHRLPDGQVTSKPDLPPAVLTCASVQMLWQRSNTAQTIQKYYVTYVKYIRLCFIDFIDRNFS